MLGHIVNKSYVVQVAAKIAFLHEAGKVFPTALQRAQKRCLLTIIGDFGRWRAAAANLQRLPSPRMEGALSASPHTRSSFRSSR